MLYSLFNFIVNNLTFFTGAYSNNVFPDPLSKEEEEKYIEKMMKGDKEARAKLIEHNLRLVAHIVKKFESSTNDVDDLIGIGTVGLIKGIDSFSPDKNIKLATYASRCIENEILMSLRQSRKQQGDVSLDEPLGTDRDGNAVSFADLLGTSPDLVEEEVRRRITLSGVKRALPTLPPRERLVLSLRYGLKDGAVHPQHEIAKMLGISRSYVSRVEKHAVELLREALLSGEENP